MKWYAVAAAALVVMPAIAAAQQDTAQRRTGRAQVQQDTSRGDVARTSARRSGRRANLGLSRDQVQELQQALQGAGCDPGPIDGIVGPRTRQAMTCARRQNNITGNSNTELYRALNLSFAQSGQRQPGVTTDTAAAQRTQTGVRSDTAARDTSVMRRDTTGLSPMRRDTTGRDTTGRDTTRGRPPTSGSDTTRRPPPAR